MQPKGKVVIVGVCDVEGSTNIYMAKAFERLGYEVVPCNYRSILNKYGEKTLEAVLFKLSEDKPSLMLFSKFNGVKSSVIAKCSLACKTWLWFMDPLVTLHALPEIIEHANVADYVSATGLGVADEIKRAIGGADVHHIMEGVDPEIYRPTVKLNDYHADISFIGAANEERMRYIQALHNAGALVKAYGKGFGNEVHGTDFSVVCSSSASMLAINTEHTVNEYFSDRVLRFGACGSFVFHSYSPRMEKYFVDGQDLVYFDTPASLIDAMNFYFQPDKYELRNSMVVSLRNKVLENHTWETAVKKIIEIAGI